MKQYSLEPLLQSEEAKEHKIARGKVMQIDEHDWQNKQDELNRKIKEAQLAKARAESRLGPDQRPPKVRLENLRIHSDSSGVKLNFRVSRELRFPALPV